MESLFKSIAIRKREWAQFPVKQRALGIYSQSSGLGEENGKFLRRALKCGRLLLSCAAMTWVLRRPASYKFVLQAVGLLEARDPLGYLA